MHAMNCSASDKQYTYVYHAKNTLLLLSNRRMWNNVMRSRWNIALPWKHYTQFKLTYAFVANKVCECIL